MITMRIYVLLALFIAFAPYHALASTTSSISSPVVTEGETSFGARIGYSTADNASSDDERLRSRLHIDHGFTDFYATRLVIAQDDRKGDSFEHASLTLENRFHFLKKATHGFDFGLKANYSYKDGDKKADDISLQFYERIPYKRWEIRLGQLFDHEIGEDSEPGITAQWRMQAIYPVTETFKAGIEGFHNFGNLRALSGYNDQSHTIGPVFKGKLTENLGYETGYRVGISKSAPDHSLKFFVTQKF